MAVRSTIGVLQGEVIVLFGVFIVAGDCWAEVLKGGHQQVVQTELRMLVQALAGGVCEGKATSERRPLARVHRRRGWVGGLRWGGGGRLAATITRSATVITRPGSCVSGP